MSKKVTSCQNPSCGKSIVLEGKAKYCSPKCKIAHFRLLKKTKVEWPKKKEPIEVKVYQGSTPKMSSADMLPPISMSKIEMLGKGAKKAKKSDQDQVNFEGSLPEVFQSKLTIEEGLTDRGIFVPGETEIITTFPPCEAISSNLNKRIKELKGDSKVGEGIPEAKIGPILPSWVQKVQGFCEKHEITPDDLIKFFVEGGKPGKGKEEKTKAPAQTGLSYLDRRRQLKNGSGSTEK